MQKTIYRNVLKILIGYGTPSFPKVFTAPPLALLLFDRNHLEGRTLKKLRIGISRWHLSEHSCFERVLNVILVVILCLKSCLNFN